MASRTDQEVEGSKPHDFAPCTSGRWVNVCPPIIAREPSISLPARAGPRGLVQIIDSTTHSLTASLLGDSPVDPVIPRRRRRFGDFREFPLCDTRHAPPLGAWAPSVP